MREATVSELVDKLSYLIAGKVLVQIEEGITKLTTKGLQSKTTNLQRTEVPIDTIPEDVFLTARDVSKKLTVSRTTIWRLERAGKFPKRRKISLNKVAWLKSEIEEWMRKY